MCFVHTYSPNIPYEQIASRLASVKKDSVSATTSGMTDNVQSATLRRRKWFQSLPEDRKIDIRANDRLRKKKERAMKRAGHHGRMQDATPPPKDGPSTDMEMDIDFNDESDSHDIVLTRPRQNRISYSKIVQVDSDTSDEELDGPSYAPDTECQISPRNIQRDDDISKDMTSGVIGRKVPAQSGTVRWQDGRLTVLPTIMKNGVNICESGDVKVVKFFASFQESTPSSQHVLHLSAADMEREDIVQTIEFSLRDNKPVVVRGNAINSPNDITTEWLDRKFGISPDMPVSIHGKCRRIFQ
jgi:hypothetical protein